MSTRLAPARFVVSPLPLADGCVSMTRDITCWPMTCEITAAAVPVVVGSSGTGRWNIAILLARYVTPNFAPDTKNMKTGLLSVCLGANSTIVDMHKHSEELTHIRTLLALQPVTAGLFVDLAMERAGIPDGTARFEQALYQRTGLHLKELWPTEFAMSVTVPTMVAQVRRDFTIRPPLIEETFGYNSTTDKKLLWIEGTDQRFQGYNHVGCEPQAMLE